MLTLRQATEADAAEVRRLWRENPVGGQVPYYFDGVPSGKPGYRLYLIEWDGWPVGTISACPETLGDRPSLYLSDAVLDRAARGRGLAARAVCRAFEDARTPDTEVLTAVYSRDNDDTVRVLKSRHFTVLYETPFEVSYLPALRWKEPCPTTDYEQVCELVNSFYARHAFFQPLAPEALARREDFTILAEQCHGQMVTCVGVWRQQGMRRLMLVRPRRGLRAALWGVSLCNRRLRVAGDNGARELVAHVLTEPAFASGHQAAFHRLLDTVGWGRDAHCFQLAAHPECPVAAEARRRLRFGFRSMFTVFRPSDRVGTVPAVRGPVYHDYSVL